MNFLATDTSTREPVLADFNCGWSVVQMLAGLSMRPEYADERRPQTRTAACSASPEPVLVALTSERS